MTLDSPPIAAFALPSNPVWRSYAGGRVLRRFRGMGETADDHFPEDWLASTVRARNGENSQGPDEGLSRIAYASTKKTLTDVLKGTPEFWLGSSEAGQRGVNVLWKLLDSSVRLQFQAHPDVSFARKHLNSNAGKTECWYIIATREDACVYLGFQRPPTRKAWARMINEQSVGEMLECFDRIPVQSGNCFVIPAGTPHAIGQGVFMMELMEPTDWVVRCETLTAGVILTPDQCFMGLGLERCLDVFDYGEYSLEQVREHFQQPRRVVNSTGDFLEEELINEAHHSFFRLHRVRGRGVGHWVGGELMLVVVLKGAGELRSGSQPGRRARAGETYLLPAAATAWQWAEPQGEWELLIAKLPVPGTGVFPPPDKP